MIIIGIIPASSCGIVGLIAASFALALIITPIFNPICTYVRDRLFPAVGTIAIVFAVIAALIVFFRSASRSLWGFIGTAITAVAISAAGYYLVMYTFVDGDTFASFLVPSFLPALCCSIGIAVVGAVCRLCFRTTAPARLASLGVQFILAAIFLKTSFGADAGTMGSIDTIQEGIAMGLQMAICGVLSFACCLPGTIISSLSGGKDMD